MYIMERKTSKIFIKSLSQDKIMRCLGLCRHQRALQSAKILFLPLKYEIIMVPSNHYFFQYGVSNIELFFSLLSSFFVSILSFFFDGFHSKVIALSRS